MNKDAQSPPYTLIKMKVKEMWKYAQVHGQLPLSH